MAHAGSNLFAPSAEGRGFDSQSGQLAGFEFHGPKTPIRTVIICTHFIINNVFYVDSTEVVPVHFGPTEISDDMTSTPLTDDLYSLDINDDDHILAEFPVLRADSVLSQASKTKRNKQKPKRKQSNS